MKTSVVIIKEAAQMFTLRIACNIGTKQEFVTRRTFLTLEAAIEAASVLQLHIDNNHKLPIKQYLKAA